MSVSGSNVEHPDSANDRGELDSRTALIAMVSLLVVVGIMLWLASAAPYGNGVIVTIRNP